MLHDPATRLSVGAATRGPGDSRPSAQEVRLVDRERLRTLLDRTVAQKVTAMVAPSGFGKTTALQQWAAGLPDAGIRWLAIRPEHNVAGAFASALCALVDERADGPASRSALPRVRYDERSMGGAFIRALLSATRGRPPALVVVDDIHVLADDALAGELVAFVNGAPAGWHFVFAGTQLPARLHQHLLTRDVVRIDADDLRFDIEEATALLDAWGVDVTDTQARDAIARSGGSAAGLTMTAMLLGGEPYVAATTDESPAADPVRSLIGQLIAQQPAAVRRFLLDSSVLEIMSGPLCDHVTQRTGSEALLATVVNEAGVFMRRDDRDGRWCRYHDVYRSGLRAVLRAERPHDERALLERAADWYLARDELEAAFGHLRELGAWDRIIDEVLARGAVVIQDARYPVERWFAAIPAEVRERRPEARLFEAGSEVLRGDSRRVTPTVEGVDADDPGLAVIAEQLRASAAVKEGRLVEALGRSAEVVAGLDLLTDEQLPRLRGLVSGREDLEAWARMVRGIARLGTGDIEGAGADLAEQVTGNDASVWYAARLAWRSFVEAWSGELTAADRSAREALKLAVELDLHRQTVTPARLALAHVAICRTDVDEAAAVLSGVADAGGLDVRPLIRCLLATEQARLALATDDIERGLDLVADDTLRETAPLFHARCRAVEANLRMVIGDETGAERALAIAPVEIADVAVARMVLALARDDHDDARRILTDWPAVPEPRARWERDLWSAVLAHREGDGTHAEHLFLRTLSEAEPEHHVAIFRSPRNKVLALARAVYRSAPSPFLRGVVEDASWHAPRIVPGLFEQLTEREYEILTLLPTRLSNEEIAARLDISVNTVKTHLKHIYRKLGVELRPDAVVEAERLWLL